MDKKYPTETKCGFRHSTKLVLDTSTVSTELLLQIFLKRVGSLGRQKQSAYFH